MRQIMRATIDMLSEKNECWRYVQGDEKTHSHHVALQEPNTSHEQLDASTGEDGEHAFRHGWVVEVTPYLPPATSL